MQNLLRQFWLWIKGAANHFSTEHSSAHVSACGFVFVDEDGTPVAGSSGDAESENPPRCD
ncbi:hypothetical protein NKI86_29135 [Mesorhizobium sp. M0320]|uniref:hypothetical protein n=1 Tax=Mesorhizobium sp. M0320 TaxID=2956936 RepID=UPI00333DF797